MGNAAVAGILALGIGIIILSLVLSIAVYVVCAYAQYKALKFMGYDKPWMGWIPYASNYAMADAIGEENVELLGGKIKLPMSTFKYYWVVNIILAVLGWVIPLGTIINIISIAYNIICLGWILKKFYARIDNREEEDVKVLAYVSAFSVLYIIAVVKFLGIKNTKEY